LRRNLQFQNGVCSWLTAGAAAAAGRQRRRRLGDAGDVRPTVMDGLSNVAPRDRTPSVWATAAGGTESGFNTEESTQHEVLYSSTVPVLPLNS